MRWTRNVSVFTCKLLVAVILTSLCAQLLANDSFAVPGGVASVLHQHCLDCHGGDSAEGDVRFDMLEKLNKEERLELLNKAQEQLFFRRMPPDEAAQPSKPQRELLVDWLSQELHKNGGSKLEDKLQKP